MGISPFAILLSLLVILSTNLTLALLDLYFQFTCGPSVTDYYLQCVTRRDSTRDSGRYQK